MVTSVIRKKGVRLGWATGACEKFHKFRLRVCGAVRTLPANVRSMLASALSFFLAFGFAACGRGWRIATLTRVNRLYEQAEETGKVVSIKEVESVLGPADAQRTFSHRNADHQGTARDRYYYQQAAGPWNCISWTTN